ncbi:MAG: UDP-glucose 4-epimerase [Verrucomicrobiales bacterium]|jgi:UDP-glucose 4-epimerase
MANVIVTGGRGRLAQTLFRLPEWAEHRVVFASREPEDGMISNAELCRPDTLDKFDVVFHLAWSSVPSTASAEKTEQDLEFLEQLLAGLARTGNPQFAFFSTGAVYGDAPADRGSLETDEPQPFGSYAKGKLQAEKRILKFAERAGIPASVLRISNAYGSTGKDTRQGVIPLLIEMARRGWEFVRAGNSTKDYLHVDDLSSALRAVATGALNSGIYNIGSGENRSLQQVIDGVSAAVGKPIRHSEGVRSVWDVADNRLDSAKFQEATGWKAAMTFEEGVKRLVDSA